MASKGILLRKMAGIYIMQPITAEGAYPTSVKSKLKWRKR